MREKTEGKPGKQTRDIGSIPNRARDQALKNEFQKRTSKEKRMSQEKQTRRKQ